MKKLIGGLLMVSAMLIGSVAMAADTNWTAASTTDVTVTNPSGAYAYFINQTTGLASTIGGKEIIYNPSRLPGSGYSNPTTVKEDAVKAAGGNTDFIGYDMTIAQGNALTGLAKDSGSAQDTAFLAYGTNAQDTWINFDLDMDIEQNIAGDMKLDDLGIWTLTFDSGDQNSKTITLNGGAVPMRFAGSAAHVNQDMVAPVTLSVDNVGVEARQGEWKGSLTATIMPGVNNF